jgi:hypothetical protein
VETAAPFPQWQFEQLPDCRVLQLRAFECGRRCLYDHVIEEVKGLSAHAVWDSSFEIVEAGQSSVS